MTRLKLRGESAERSRQVVGAGLVFVLAAAFSTVPARGESRGRRRATAGDEIPVAGYVGRAVHVDDGDTFTLESGRQRVRIRIAEIDAPEMDQPYGSRARQALSTFVSGERIRVVGVDRDRYGRIVARVYAGSVDVGAEMVRQGAAWVYRRYARTASLGDLERAARDGRRGVWALPEAEREPPWQWRREHERTGAVPRGFSHAPAGPIVGNRRSLVYHRPGCPDYHKVSLRNRETFGSRAAAEAAGYREARNCP